MAIFSHSQLSKGFKIFLLKTYNNYKKESDIITKKVLPDTSGVYKIENIKNGKVYVGSTQNIRLRRNNHVSDLRHDRHHNTHLQSSFNKHGEDNFKFYILEFCDINRLKETEHYWIKKLKSNNREFGYNSRIYVSSNRGFRHSEQTKKKISISKKGVKIAEYNISEEMRKKKSEMCKEQNLLQYHTPEIEEKRLRNLREALCDKPISNKHKQDISKANKGEGNGMSKLTESDVIKIKKLLKSQNITQTDIAEMFNVSRRAISLIKTGDRWSHVKIG